MLKKAVGFQNIIYKAISFNSSILRLLKMPFYAVAKGRASGIFMSWPDCEAQVKGFSGARYKKFDTVVAAQEYIDTIGTGNIKQKPESTNNSNTTSASSYLKRTYSTASNGQPFSQNDDSHKRTNKTKKKTTKDSEDSHNSFSDDDDDINSMLSKQLDDVEKRLKGFEKNVDKIIKKGSKPIRKTILIEPPKPKRRKNSGAEFEEDNEGYVQVYTDGACSSNGRNGAKAGLGVYWGDGHPMNISEPVSGRATNNCGEIQAATCAIKVALQNGITKLSINTDSKFLINSVTKWMSGWKRKGWKLKSGEPVKNEEDFKDLDSVQNKLDIKWNYVEAHRGIHGNEMADNLAKSGAAMYVTK